MCTQSRQSGLLSECFSKPHLTLFSLPILSLPFLLGAANLEASSFQHALQISYQTQNSKLRPTNQEIDVDQTAAYYQFFLKANDLSKGPWEKAAFLNRHSNLGIQLLNRELDNSNLTSNEDKATTGAVLHGQYFFMPNAYITVDLLQEERSESATAANNGDDSEKMSWFLTPGYYLTDTSQVFALYSVIEEDDGSDAKSYGIGYEKLFNIAKQQYVDLDLRFTQNSFSTRDNSTEYRADFTIYPNQKLGLGLGAVFENSNTNFHSFSLFSKWYYSPRIAVSGEVKTRRSEQNDGDQFKQRSTLWNFGVNLTY